MIKPRSLRLLPIVSALGLVFACGGNTDDGATTSSGETIGDGDGDPSGDGDGDPGDGDGDPGDGDGDPTGDGDGDPTGDGDGDGDGDPPVDACSFDAQVLEWSVPAPIGGADLHEFTAQGLTCNNNEDYRYSTFDLSGDGAPDLVVTDLCDAAGVGSTGWEIYENTGTGFDPMPMDWSLPMTIGGEDVHEFTTQGLTCNNNEDYRYSTFDLSGDGAPDLVVTDLCDAETVGSTHWDLYTNTGVGFADAPIEWSLPAPIGGADLHEFMAEGLTCNNNEDYRYSTLDLTGDGAPDLVVTDLCDAGEVGTDRWDVYENTGAGFDDVAIEWSLPTPIGGMDIHELLAQGLTCNNNEDYRYSTFDLTGDGAPDLVVTDLCDAGGVGTDRWDVYENTGTGFAAVAIEWSLPAPIGGDDLHEFTAQGLTCNNNEDYRFSTLDVTGDGAPDLVVTDLCDADGVGSGRWDVYKNMGTGFAEAPIEWSLPAPIGGDDLHEFTAQGLTCNNNEDYRFSTFDLSGDRAPDLVVTDLCDAEEVGSVRWELYVATCDMP
ncbi:hypothetical protein ENSA5_11760 [Enhygromyxa salina]|uniref:Uncharacterized protein n=1 Tax=Enhygromyxa salina TaxID=215803 RepID=A0A2S9YFV1_9BACT|nr:hypothetical protein [Enhygromyxa salina]PRQ03993.1 hypothetical protein ENSA5_11760 [Enhygromyxa salina]